MSKEVNTCNMNDLVSIIMPCFNSEKTISLSILSVINQTYKEWELIVVDDFSTDNTCSIVKGYALKDNRIKIIELEKKGGASIARNKAIDTANGKYIAFLDSDDLWLPNKLEKQVEFMKNNNYVFTYTNYYVEQNGKIYIRTAPKIVDFKLLCKRNPIGCLTVMYDNDEIGKIEIPKLDKRNDYALWLKIMQKNVKGHLLNETLSIYKDHNGISSGSNIKKLKYHYFLFKKILRFPFIKAEIYFLRNIVYMIMQLLTNYLRKEGFYK